MAWASSFQAMHLYLHVLIWSAVKRSFFLMINTVLKPTGSEQSILTFPFKPFAWSCNKSETTQNS